MTPEFNPCDPATWSMSLNVQQIAEIYQKTIGAVRKACQLGKFHPEPYEKQPYRWRKVDVERHLIGARGFSGTRKVG